MLKQLACATALIAAAWSIEATGASDGEAFMLLKGAPDQRVYGVTLDEKPTLPSCPMAGPGKLDKSNWIKRGARTCLEAVPVNTSEDGRERLDPVQLDPRRIPQEFGSVDSCYIKLLDGKVAALIIWTKGESVQESAFSVLRKMYGVPSMLSRGTSVKLSRGVFSQHNQLTAIWRFKNLTVSFFGWRENGAHGRLDISTSAMVAWRNAHAKVLHPQKA